MTEFPLNRHYDAATRARMVNEHAIQPRQANDVFEALEDAANVFLRARHYQEAQRRRKDHDRSMKASVETIAKKLEKMEFSIIQYLSQREMEAMGASSGRELDPRRRDVRMQIAGKSSIQTPEDYFECKGDLIRLLRDVCDADLPRVEGSEADLGLGEWMQRIRAVWRELIGGEGFSSDFEKGEPANAVTHFVCDALSVIHDDIRQSTIEWQMRKAAQAYDD